MKCLVGFENKREKDLRHWKRNGPIWVGPKHAPNPGILSFLFYSDCLSITLCFSLAFYLCVFLSLWIALACYLHHCPLFVCSFLFTVSLSLSFFSCDYSWLELKKWCMVTIIFYILTPPTRWIGFWLWRRARTHKRFLTSLRTQDIFVNAAAAAASAAETVEWREDFFFFIFFCHQKCFVWFLLQIGDFKRWLELFRFFKVCLLLRVMDNI